MPMNSDREQHQSVAPALALGPKRAKTAATAVAVGIIGRLRDTRHKSNCEAERQQW